MENLNQETPKVNLSEKCSPVILPGMDRACPCIPNGSDGYFVLLDENPLDQEYVKRYRSISADEAQEAKTRYLDSIPNKSNIAA